MAPSGRHAGWATSLKEYREEVLRDLLWLLNTSCHPAASAIHEFEQVATSTLNFGTRDFVGVSASSLDPVEVADAVRDAISKFEPRISTDTLVVSLVQNSNVGQFDRFALEISGDLWALPATEPLRLTTTWDVVGGAWTFD
jgi:type VI secretion system protein ImpF